MPGEDQKETQGLEKVTIRASKSYLGNWTIESAVLDHWTSAHEVGKDALQRGDFAFLLYWYWILKQERPAITVTWMGTRILGLPRR